jgi:Fe-S cluster assembly ATPase SufC
VRGVSIEVPKGEVVTIIGVNGAGKNTLRKSIVGLEPVTAGRVVLDGRDITATPPHRRTALGVALSPEGRGVSLINRCATICCSEPTQKGATPLEPRRSSGRITRQGKGRDLLNDPKVRAAYWGSC